MEDKTKEKKIEWADLFTDPGKFINEDSFEKIKNDPKLMEILSKIK